MDSLKVWSNFIPSGAAAPNGYTGSVGFSLALDGGANLVGYLGLTQAFLDLTVGALGSEGSYINVNGVTFSSTFKVSDINGNHYAQSLFHRHSTVLEPLLVGARSNSNIDTPADIVAGMNVFSVYGTGWLGADYKMLGSISIAGSSLGVLGASS